MSQQALSDVSVVDLTHYIAGPYCTKLLADYGADVVKIEKPKEGDLARKMGPFPKDAPHPEKSGLFLYLNTNKKSVTLNLKSETGKEIFKELVNQADILVENFSPRVMPSLGLAYETLERINPKLVVTSISNFGQTGPYRDFKATELILYGMGGEMYSTGVEEREPVKLGGSIVQYQAGTVAAAATLGALYASENEGIGQHVDISIMETQACSIDRRAQALLAYQYAGELTVRYPPGGMGYPAGYYPCRDGYFRITGGLTFFPSVVKMLGEPEALKDQKWYAPTAQVDPGMKGEFEAIFIPWCMERTRQEIWAGAQPFHVFCAPLNTTKDLINDPQLRERGFFVEIDHPMTGKVEYPGRPFIMSETPWQLRRPAPLLGQHNEAIYTQLGYSKDDLARLRETGII